MTEVIKDNSEGNGIFSERVDAFLVAYEKLHAVYSGAYEQQAFPGQELTSQEHDSRIGSMRFSLVKDCWEHIKTMQGLAKTPNELQTLAHYEKILKDFFVTNRVSEQLLFNPFTTDRDTQ